MISTKRIYSKSNTLFWSVLRSPGLVLYSLKWIYHFKTIQPNSDKNIKITAEVKITPIINEYNKIEDPKERDKARMNSIESDLNLIRYFSDLRKAGYIIMGIEFILQFFTFIFK